MQPEDVARDDKLCLFQKTTAQLTLLPEVCARLVAMCDRAGWETCPWCMFISTAQSLLNFVVFVFWLLFKTVFQNFTGKSRDDTGNSGGEGDG